MALEDFGTYSRRSNQNKQITLSKFVPEVCDVIYRKLDDKYLRVSIFTFYDL